ncbi:MAG: hypothetical protein JW990_19780 [Thermoleophilia bacterium]|nr:hypothetical protein [Thermoleophilia bacterium]
MSVDLLALDGQPVASGLGLRNHSHADPSGSTDLGAPITTVPGKVRMAGPLTYIRDGMPPILIRHAGLRRQAPSQQTVGSARSIEAWVFDFLDRYPE